MHAVRTRLAASPAGAAERPDRLRQDPLRRPYGGAARPAAAHRRLPRRSHRGRSHRRYLLKGGDTVWADGPLTRAVREGGICYLDEVVEARKDVTVVLHPLTDDRRILPLERTGEELVAPPGFMLVVSYNPGYQSFLRP